MAVLALAQAGLESEDAAEWRGAAVHEAQPVACEQEGELKGGRKRSSAGQEHRYEVGLGLASARPVSTEKTSRGGGHKTGI